MKLLLDTHLLLWGAGNPDRLSPLARAFLSDRSNEFLFSAVSMWEIAIKGTLNRPDFTIEARVLRRGLLDRGFTELPIISEHAMYVVSLPTTIHKDPFDRLLISQATVEGITLLTSDSFVAQYPGPIQRV
jgi:PIN domain nuclease of toxin-antitoxin system